MFIDFLPHIEAESRRFGDVLASTDPGAAVPTCPDWTAADLLWHLAEVQLFWTAIVGHRLRQPQQAEAAKPDRPADYQALLGLYRDASALLIDTLADTADDVPVWTWLDSNQTTGFVRRRQAHEALIHRIDAELTAGTPVAAVDPTLAADGVDEALTAMYGGIPDWATQDLDGPVGAVVASDTGSRWLVQIARFSGISPNSGTTYTDAPTLLTIPTGEASFQVSGTARDLDAWLWNRPTLTDICTEGEGSAQFRAIIRGGLQ